MGMDTHHDQVQVRCSTSAGGVCLTLSRSSLTSKRPILLIMHETIPDGAPPAVWRDLVPACDVVHAYGTDHDRYASALQIETFARAVGIAVEINFASRRVVTLGESMMATAALALADGATSQVKGAIAWDPPLNSSGAFAYRGSWLRDALETGRLGTFVRSLLGKRHDRLSGAKLTRRVLRETQAPVLVLLREVVSGQALSLDEIIEAISAPADAGKSQATILANVSWHHLEGYDKTSFYQPSRPAAARIRDFILDAVMLAPASLDEAARKSAS